MMCETNKKLHQEAMQVDSTEPEFTEEMRQKILATLEAFSRFVPGGKYEGKEGCRCD